MSCESLYAAVTVQGRLLIMRGGIERQTGQLGGAYSRRPAAVRDVTRIYSTSGLLRTVLQARPATEALRQYLVEQRTSDKRYVSHLYTAKSQAL